METINVCICYQVKIWGGNIYHAKSLYLTIVLVLHCLKTHQCTINRSIMLKELDMSVCFFQVPRPIREAREHEVSDMASVTRKGTFGHYT